jgi:CheY-like chemotaxis protein
MEIAEKYDFIVIDDSKLDCFIAEKIIQNTGKSTSIKTFMAGSDALAYLQSLAISELQQKIIILLDIQMPVMNGFEFVEAFELTIPEKLKKQICINLLSSSINESDMIRAQSYHSIFRFLNKPLNKDILLNTIQEWQF